MYSGRKEIHTRISIVIITLLLLVIGHSTTFSQQSNSSPVPSTKSDSILVAKKKQSFTGFFKRLLGVHKRKAPKDTTAVSSKKKKSDTTKVVAKKIHPSLLDFTKGGVTWTSLYTQGVNLNTGVTGFYQLANVFQNFDVEGIPLTAQVTGVEQNGQLMKDYSSYSINFDSRTFLDALQKRAQNAALNKMATDKSHLPSGQHMNLSDSLNAFESTRAKLTSPSYQAEITAAEQRVKKIEDSIAKSEGKKMNDSLKRDEKNEMKSKDSLNKSPKQDSLSKSHKADTTELHSLRQKIAAYEKLEKRYNQLFAIKKNYNNLSKADSAEKNIESKYTKDENQLNNPDNIKKMLLGNKMLSPYEKFLMGFQYITIGRSNEEMSEFTLHNFMMNGVNVGYKTGNTYASAGYGHEQAVVNPYLMTGISVPTYNRTVEYASAGIGAPNQSNLYVTAINISDPGSTASLAENNWILDLSKKIVLAKNFDVTGEIAHSYFNYVPNSKLDSVIPSPSANVSDMAYKIKAHGIVPGLHTDVTAEYLSIGEDYVSLGNQFLLSGTKTYRLKFKQRVSKKLSLEVGGAHVVQNQSNLTGTQGTDNWVDFGAKYKPTNFWDMAVDYLPRQFQQVQGTVVANSLTNNINQMSFTSNIKAECFGRDMLTSVFVGNFQYNTPEATTFLTQNVNLTYYMLNEMIMLTSYSSLNFTGNESRSNWTGSISQFIGEGVYSMNIGKSFMFSAGGQWVEQPGVIADGAGIIGSVGKMFGKWGKFSLQLNCRNNVANLFDFNTGQVLISTNASLFW